MRYINLIFQRLSLAFLSFVLITGSVYSQAEDSFGTAIDEEFKWLQEEASAEMVTVATKTRMTAEEAPSIVSVITGEEIRNMGARSIIDILRTVPGFDMTHSLITPSTQVNIRGMRSATWNDKIKIMIDGHSMQVFFGEPNVHFDALPVASIKKIEIIRGPGSALYGTGAFLGVINIITKQGGDEPSRIAVEGGSYDTIKPYAELSHKAGDFKTYLYADYYKTNGYDDEIKTDMTTNAPVIPGFGPIFAPSESREMTNDSKHYTGQWNINYKDLYFSGFAQKVESNNPIGGAKALTDEDDVDYLYIYGELGYNHQINDKGGFLIKGYYDYGDQQPTWELFPEESSALHVGFPEDEGILGKSPAKLSILGVETTVDYELFEGMQLVAGASYERYKLFDVENIVNCNITGHDLEIDGETYPGFPYIYFPNGMTDISEQANWLKEADRDITAFYGQLTVDLKKLFSLEKSVKSLSLTAGLRHDHYRNKDEDGNVNTNSSTNPRFGLVYVPTEKLYFKALYGQAFRAATFKELYTQNNPAYTGNEAIAPEEITTMEGLVGYHFSKNMRGSLTYFHTKAENLIQTVGIVPQNIGEMESDGIEGELKLNFDKNKYAYCNFTWQEVKNTTQGADFNPGNIPEYYGNAGFNWGLTENLVANIAVNYVGERERSEETDENGEKLDKRDPVAERWLLNASLTFKDFLAKGMEFQLSGFNLLDEDYRDPDPEGLIYYDMPREGASVTGRLSYSF